jgi:hypothetical protein
MDKCCGAESDGGFLVSVCGNRTQDSGLPRIVRRSGDDESVDGGGQHGSAVVVDVITEQFDAAGRNGDPIGDPTASERIVAGFNRAPNALACRCPRKPVHIASWVSEFQGVRDPEWRALAVSC